MEKPIKKEISEPVYNYRDIINYIENKYKIKVRDYAGKFSKKNKNAYKDDNVPYLDFWHYIMDGCNGNGSFMYLPGMSPDEANSLEELEEWKKGDDEYTPKWVREIMYLIIKEFYPDPNEWDNMKVWVDW